MRSEATGTFSQRCWPLPPTHASLRERQHTPPAPSTVSKASVHHTQRCSPTPSPLSEVPESHSDPSSRLHLVPPPYVCVAPLPAGLGVLAALVPLWTAPGPARPGTGRVRAWPRTSAIEGAGTPSCHCTPPGSLSWLGATACLMLAGADPPRHPLPNDPAAPRPEPGLELGVALHTGPLPPPEGDRPSPGVR